MQYNFDKDKYNRLLARYSKMNGENSSILRVVNWLKIGLNVFLILCGCMYLLLGFMLPELIPQIVIACLCLLIIYDLGIYKIIPTISDGVCKMFGGSKKGFSAVELEISDRYIRIEFKTENGEEYTYRIQAEDLSKFSFDAVSECLTLEAEPVTIWQQNEDGSTDSINWYTVAVFLPIQYTEKLDILEELARIIKANGGSLLIDKTRMTGEAVQTK
jgi:hypothetical protein